MTRFPAALLAALLVAVPAAAAPLSHEAPSVGLVNHRALYRISLDHTTPGSPVQGITGQMLLEVRATCDGNAVTQLLKTEFWDDDGQARKGELTSSSFERADGRSYRFTFSNRVDGAIIQAFRGRAKRRRVAAEGAITYDKNKFDPAVLPARSVFPLQHLEQLLTAAASGKHVVKATVFDGAEDAKIFNSTAVIGPEAKSGKAPAPALAGVAHWPVSMSYFDLGSNEQLPDYQTSFRIYANGVTDREVMDYGDFAMKANLTALELLPPPKCGGAIQ
jgi:hypothetical protein